MHAAALRVELRIPEAHSLKEKRGILKRVIADLKREFGVSVSEVDHQDLWQRATLGVALVAPQAGRLQRLMHTIERRLEGMPDVEYLRMAVSYLEDPP